MDKVTDIIFKIKGIITTIAVIFFVGILGYWGYEHFIAEATITSKNEYFTVKVSKRYTFVEDTKISKDDHEMAVYDKDSGVYIFGYAYTKDGSLKTFTEEERAEIFENEKFKKVSEVKEEKAGKLTAYTYTYEYIDNNNDNYFMKVVYVEGKKADYLLLLESPTATLDSHEKQLNKIMKSFIEN